MDWWDGVLVLSEIQIFIVWEIQFVLEEIVDWCNGLLVFKRYFFTMMIVFRFFEIDFTVQRLSHCFVEWSDFDRDCAIRLEILERMKILFFRFSQAIDWKNTGSANPSATGRYSCAARISSSDLLAGITALPTLENVSKPLNRQNSALRGSWETVRYIFLGKI